MPDDAVAAHERGIAEALREGWKLLSAGATAVEAVEAAVSSMEDDDTFDAGRGSFLTRDGRVQLDALLMDGATLRTGGVACVERLRNPIRAARLVLEQSPHVYFVGDRRRALRPPARHGALRQHRPHRSPRARPPHGFSARRARRRPRLHLLRQRRIQRDLASPDPALAQPSLNQTALDSEVEGALSRRALRSPARPHCSTPTTPSAPSPSTGTATSPRPPLPAEPSRKPPAASATRPSSAAAATPTTSPPRSPSPAGANPS